MTNCFSYRVTTGDEEIDQLVGIMSALCSATKLYRTYRILDHSFVLGQRNDRTQQGFPFMRSLLLIREPFLQCLFQHGLDEPVHHFSMGLDLISPELAECPLFSDDGA